MEPRRLVAAALAVRDDGIKHDAEHDHEYAQARQQDEIMQLQQLFGGVGDGPLEAEPVIGADQAGNEPEADGDDGNYRA